MLAVTMAVAACTSTGTNESTVSSRSASTDGTTAASVVASSVPAPPSSTTPETPSPEERARALCGRGTVEVVGAVTDPVLTEISGVVTSRRDAGVMWVHDDGGVGAVHAIAPDGTSLGEVAIGVDTTDVEDIAALGADTDAALLIGDIGDNGASREHVQVVRVAEPDPGAMLAPTDVEVLVFRYPDRPHDAEALLVDERTGHVVIVTKEQAPDEPDKPAGFGDTMPSFVFEGPLDDHSGEVIDLAHVGTIDTPAIETRTRSAIPHPVSLLGFGGVVTGGDVSPDGALVALRTYEAVWVWPVMPGQSIAEAVLRLDEFPCQVPSAVERQGEAVAFVGEALATISEGDRPTVHLLGR